MYTGYEYSTKSGSSIGVNDFEIPDAKNELIEKADAEVVEIERQYSAGSGDTRREVQQGDRHLVTY
jgi:DNA-directed RNA polymerase subunit beta'